MAPAIANVTQRENNNLFELLYTVPFIRWVIDKWFSFSIPNMMGHQLVCEIGVDFVYIIHKAAL